jgi:hypothetical protein
MSLDVVPVGTFHGSASVEAQIRDLVHLGSIEIKPGLNLARSSDPQVIWSAMRPHIDRVIHFDLFGYDLCAFVINHEDCIQAFAEDWPGQRQMIESLRYWVFNCPAPASDHPSIALSSEIEDRFIVFPAFHEALENAIALQGVFIDGALVPVEGRCAVSAKVEIASFIDTFGIEELATYLRTREHMFANIGDAAEFQGSLTVIRKVLSLLE